MENAIKEVSSLKEGEIAYLISRSFEYKTGQFNIIKTLVNKRKKIQYLTIDKYGDDLLQLRELFELELNEEYFIVEEFNPTYSPYERCYNLKKEILKHTKGKDFDYLVLNYDTEGYQVTNAQNKNIAFQIQEAASELKIPIICLVSLDEGHFDKNRSRVLDRLFYDLKGIADVIVLFDHINFIEVDITTLNLRVTMTKESYYNEPGDLEFIKKGSKFDNYYLNARVLGLDELDSYNCAKIWYQDEKENR